MQSAFNIANSIGAYLGGLVIAHGLGLVSPNLVGSMLAVLGLVLAVVSGTLDRNAQRKEAARDATVAGDARAVGTDPELAAVPA